MAPFGRYFGLSFGGSWHRRLLAVQTLFFDTSVSSLRTEAEGILLALKLVSALLTSGSRFLKDLHPQWSV